MAVFARQPKKVAVRRVSTVVFWVSGFHNWSINSWRLEILLQDQDVTNAVTGSFFSVKLSIPRNFMALLNHAWKHWVLTCWLKWCFLENSSPAADFLAQGLLLDILGGESCKLHPMFRVVTKVSSFSLKQQVGRESNRYMGISVGSVFLLFFCESTCSRRSTSK